MQKIKITKRQRKARMFRNAMVQHSLKHGKHITVGASGYVGAPPMFAEQKVPMMPSIWRKVQSGVPFIRIR